MVYSPQSRTHVGQVVGGNRAKRQSFEDALEYLPILREMVEAEPEQPPTAEQKKRVEELVQATVKWEGTAYRTWLEAENDAEIMGTTCEQLRSDMYELLQRFAEVLVLGLADDPEWAAESLVSLVDDFEPLYNNRRASYARGGGGVGTYGGANYSVNEGAIFLKGVAAEAFNDAGGCEKLAEALCSHSCCEPSSIATLVDLIEGLANSERSPEVPVLERCYAAAGQALARVPEKSLIENRDDVQKLLRKLLLLTKPMAKKKKPASRADIEAAWQRCIAAGLRSTNLQARRGAADALAAARRWDVSAAELVPWLRCERILEELFGDRLDPRVLEELSLEPLCEPSLAGLRELLTCLEASLSHAVVYRKLHELLMSIPREADGKGTPKADAWSRDAAVAEVSCWARSLITAGRPGALALVAGLFSCSSTEGSSTYPLVADNAPRRLFSWIGDSAAVEALETLTEALLVPDLPLGICVSLEVAAFDDARLHPSGPTLLRARVDRLAQEVLVAGKEGRPCLGLSHVRLLFRAFQALPVAADHGAPPHTPTREATLKANSGLPDALLAEFRAFLAQGGKPLCEEVQWRLRLLCLVRRSAPTLVADADSLEELVRLLGSVADDGASISYLFRIAAPRQTSGLRDATGPALTTAALERSLKLLEELAARDGALAPHAFFCLQQAVVLVNGRAGRLRLQDEYQDDLTSEAFVMSMAAESDEDANDSSKGPPLQMVDQWVNIRQSDGNWQLARLGRYDDAAEQFTVEYIDETVQRRKLAHILWRPVPPLLEQSPNPLNVSYVADPTAISGCQGLWLCALGASDAEVASRATDVLLALHPSAEGVRELLRRLLDQLCSDASPMLLGRGLAILSTLVRQYPLAQRRAHLGVGYPVHLTLTEYAFVWEELPRPKWQQHDSAAKATTVRRRRQVGTADLRVHSNTTISELYVLAAKVLDKSAVELSIRDDEDTSLAANGQQTLEDLELCTGGYVLEALAISGARDKAAVPGPLDDLGLGEAAWPERLLELLNSSSCWNHPDGSNNRRLCWQLLLRLPTHERLLLETLEPEGKQWSELLSLQGPEAELSCHSLYAVLLFDALTSKLHCADGPVAVDRVPSTLQSEAERWLSAFATSGGADALLAFFVAFCVQRLEKCDKSDLTDRQFFEVIALLPPLVRTVGACSAGRIDQNSLGGDGGVALAEAAAKSTRWLFEVSKAKHVKGEDNDTDAEGQRLRLRHAAATGLNLLVEVQRRADLPMSTIDTLLMPILVSIAQQVEGIINKQVAAAIVEVSCQKDTTPLLLQHVVKAVPGAAASAAGGAAPFFDIIHSVLAELENQIAAEAKAERLELTEAVARAALAAPCNVSSIYRLLSALLRGSCNDGSYRQRLDSELGPQLTEHLLQCVLPEQVRSIGSDRVREQAAEALLLLMGSSSWELRGKVLNRIVSYLAHTPTPESFGFEPAAPKEPETSLEARRNETGYVGLTNRGCTCYMNSTMQLLFWSEPFRNAVLQASPPVADAPEKPEPLPKRSSAKKNEDDDECQSTAGNDSDVDRRSDVDSNGYNIWSSLGGDDPTSNEEQITSTTTDVGWQMQRMFTYLQDCQLGQFNTDALVEACRCLRLEYRVTSQNDAAEFFDKVCDAADTTFGGAGKVFVAKSCREKCCHSCGLRTRGRDDEMKRVQLSALCDTLEECLNELTSAETMKGDNAVDCDKCGPKRDTTYRTFFTQLPQILVLNLARITFDLETLERVKKNPRIAFPERLNMSRYTEEAASAAGGAASENVPGCSFELFGVQIHQGSAGSGHYYCYVQDMTGKWVKFNDDRVSSFDEADLEDECFGGEDHDRAARSGKSWEKSYNAYMLFYRCVDATPYRARGADTPTPTAAGTRADTPPALCRSTSEKLSSSGGPLQVSGMPKPPVLCRHTTQAFDGQRLVARQRRRRQLQLQAQLVDEVRSTNARLHCQAVVFSRPTEDFLLSLAQQLLGQLATEGVTDDAAGAGAAGPGGNSAQGSAAAAGAPREAARVLGVRSAAAESLCRLTTKFLFDILVHSKGCTEAALRPWADLVKRQLCLSGTEAPEWLLSGLAGDPDAVFGRGPAAWLPTLILRRERRNLQPDSSNVSISAVTGIILAAAEVVGETPDSPGTIALGSFVDALLSLMSSVEGASHVRCYGELWQRLASSKTLVPLLASHRGSHGSPVPFLLLHLYLGAVDTPLPAPPAPPLQPATVTATALRSLAQKGATRPREAFVPLLDAAGQILAEAPQLLQDPILQDSSIWRALARRNPEVFAEPCALREALPQDTDILKAVAQAIIEALRPTGLEDLVLSSALRAALVFVLRSGGADNLPERMAVLAEVGRQLLTAVDSSSRSESPNRRVSFGRGSGVDDNDMFDGIYVEGRSTTGTGRGGSSARNPEALQLLRILQVAAEVCPELPESWSWAREWLAKCCRRGKSGGLPKDEVLALAAALGVESGQADDAPGEEQRQAIRVEGAGSDEVNGTYVAFEDGNSIHYEQLENQTFTIVQEPDYYHGDVRWVFEEEVSDGYHRKLYRSDYSSADVGSAVPPLKSSAWMVVAGDFPCPFLELVS